MISSIEKPKIESRYGYALKTSLLEDVLKNGNIDIDVTLSFWKPQIIGSVFEVHYWLPNENIPFNRLYVRAGALLNEDISIARKYLVSDIFPEFVDWLKKIEQIDKPLRKNHYFNAGFSNSKVSIYKE